MACDPEQATANVEAQGRLSQLRAELGLPADDKPAELGGAAQPTASPTAQAQNPGSAG